MTTIGIVGTGFVADHYMRSLATFPRIKLAGAYDIIPKHLQDFCATWKVKPSASLEALISSLGSSGIILNLTNPSSHYEVSRRCIEAGVHVYSEKPLAMRLEDARLLHDLAAERGLMLASAPCGFLGESAQTMWAAVRSGILGKIRLVYAELDDDFISMAPYKKWFSESGRNWPSKDEFEVGCTLEHAGYYLTWLIAVFGSVKKVVAASACLAPDQMGVQDPAPDFSVATLFFESGIVARLTCTILAPRDHSLKIVGDRGVLSVRDCWDTATPVHFRRRFSVRRRLMYSPFRRRLRLAQQDSHPHIGRWGSTALNYALGPKEMIDALTEGRPPRVSSDFALHLTEVILAIHASGDNSGSQVMQTRCAPIEPMPWAMQLRGE